MLYLAPPLFFPLNTILSINDPVVLLHHYPNSSRHCHPGVSARCLPVSFYTTYSLESLTDFSSFPSFRCFGYSSHVGHWCDRWYLRDVGKRGDGRVWSRSCGMGHESWSGGFQGSIMGLGRREAEG